MNPSVAAANYANPREHCFRFQFPIHKLITVQLIETQNWIVSKRCSSAAHRHEIIDYGRGRSSGLVRFVLPIFIEKLTECGKLLDGICWGYTGLSLQLTSHLQNMILVHESASSAHMLPSKNLPSNVKS